MKANFKLRRFSPHFMYVLLLFTSGVYAQYTNLKFENLDTDKGLSSSTCTTIFEDKDGFMWFGTIDGLNRYDGYSFKVFQPTNQKKNSITHKPVSRLFADSNTHTDRPLLYSNPYCSGRKSDEPDIWGRR